MSARGISLLTRALAALALLSCRPDFGERESRVHGPIVLAVRAEPPEAAPGEPATFDVLAVSPEGTLASPLVAWSFCATPKLLTENGAVSAECLGDAVTPIAVAAEPLAITVPDHACATFGPETSSADLRPRDPDVTGGYFQPVRARVESREGAKLPLAFGVARLVCNLPGVSAEVVTELKARYTRNRNPVLLPLEATAGGAPVALSALPRGGHVDLRASWRPEDAEAYVALDLGRERVVARRESLRVSWFATAGAFASDRTGRTEEDPATFTENTWSAPSEPTTVHLWIVLRDARGGVAFASHEIVVR